jgi:hypothetical protein
MKQIYEKIKTTGRNYLAPAIIGLALSTGIARAEAKENSNLPISQEQREVIGERNFSQDYINALKNAEGLFNRYTSDGKLTPSEKKEILYQLNKAENSLTNISLEDQVAKDNLILRIFGGIIVSIGVLGVFALPFYFVLDLEKHYPDLNKRITTCGRPG